MMCIQKTENLQKKKKLTSINDHFRIRKSGESKMKGQKKIYNIINNQRFTNLKKIKQEIIKFLCKKYERESHHFKK